MKAWLTATLVVLAFAGATASAAEAAEVSVRVEGAQATLLETEVDTTPHQVNGGDGSGFHACSGPIGEGPGLTVTGALDDAVRDAGLAWKGQWSSSSGDFLITEIAGEAGTSSGPWSILLNGVPTPVGGCSMKVQEGDRVLFARDVVFQTMTLELSGPSGIDPGQEFTLSVEDARNGNRPVDGAEVHSGELVASTGPDGKAAFKIDLPGRYRFKATHPEGIRSNTLEVCVGVTGCRNAPGPTNQILGIPDQARFMRGATPRNLRGTTRQNAQMKVALKARNKRGPCKAWNGKNRFVKRGCKAKPRWFAAEVTDHQWQNRVGKLPPGRYRLWVRAVGTNGRPWRSGTNRVDFRVLSKKLSRKGLLHRATGFLDRGTQTQTVQASGLLAGWVGLALGVRGRKSAERLLKVLKIVKPPLASDSELARNLATIRRIRGRAAQPLMRRELALRQTIDGSFRSDVNLTAMAALALPGTETSAQAAAWLAGIQIEEGGFGASPKSPADVDTTGLAAWALASAGHSEEAASAAAFVRSQQNSDGGFPAVSGGSSNAQSTGLGMVAIRVAGGSKLGPRTADGITPTHYLATLQQPSGAVDYMPGMRTLPEWVTAQALIGLTSRRALLGFNR